MERWDGEIWLRTCRHGQGATAYACRALGSIQVPRLEVTVERAEHRALIEDELRSAFPSGQGALERLGKRDLLIGRLLHLYPGLLPVLQSDALSALVRAISAQQINLHFAATVRRRLALSYGARHQLSGAEVYSLEAARLAEARVQDLRGLQFTSAKATYLKAAAQADLAGELRLAELRELPDAEVIERLTRLPGVGLWTAEWFLARTLGRPRVVAGDLGVRKAVGRAYLGGRMPSEREVREVTVHWGEAAGLAQQLLLHALQAHTI